MAGNSLNAHAQLGYLVLAEISLSRLHGDLLYVEDYASMSGSDA